MTGSSRNAVRFLKAKNEEELQRLFLKFQIVTAKQYKVINVYPTKDGVVLWFCAYIEVGDIK